MKLHQETPESSNIFAFHYDGDTSTLTIDFNSGTRYDYYGVPESVVTDFAAATSKGTYFGRAIKHSYQFKKVG